VDVGTTIAGRGGPAYGPSMSEASTSKGSPLPNLPGRRRWTREEFERAGALGLFGPDERLELIGGEVVRKVSPQEAPHATGVRLAEEALRRALSQGFDVRAQLPLALTEDSEPEPDISVVPGTARDYAEHHPSSAALVVEVADTTLATDRGPKASLYARSGITDYWILNVVDRVLEVHRDPAPMADQPFGHHYRSITRHTARDSVDPLGAPGQSIRVADLLP
jgi:Uma2 family endonuclease